MIIRYPLTVLTLGALLLAGGAVLAGGMPSDEGPEVILDELGYDDGDSLDEHTITAIIKSEIPQPPPQAFVPADHIAVVTVAEAPAIALPNEPELGPALISPEDDWRRDHR